MRVHELAARHLAPTSGPSGWPVASAARAARPPAVAPRARRHADTIPVGFEGGQMPLQACGCRSSRASTTRSASSTRPSTSTPSRLSELESPRSPPPRCQRKGLVSQGRPRQGARPWRDQPSGHRQGPRLLEGGRGSHHGRGRYGGAPAPALGRSPPARQRQPVHQPLTRRPPGRVDRPSGARVVDPAQHLQDPRATQQGPLHAADDRALPVGGSDPGTGHRPRTRSRRSSARASRAACSNLLQTCSPVAPSPSSPCSRSGSCRTSRRRSSCRSSRW